MVCAFQSRLASNRWGTRNSPDTSRAFDEPFYYYGANGKSTNGPLPTDRPNTFKGYAYYQLPWKGMNTTLGLFQTAYQGSPQSSFTDVAGMFPNQVSEAVYVYGRGKWVNTTQDATGNITIGNPYSRRAPWFTQTDFNFGHEIKVNKNNEHQVLGFQMNITNLFNQRAVTSIYGGMNSTYLTTPLSLPGVNLSSGAALYQATMSGYDVQALINGTPTTPRTIQSGQYGMPFTYQLARGIRFMVHYTF